MPDALITLIFHVLSLLLRKKKSPFSLFRAVRFMLAIQQIYIILSLDTKTIALYADDVMFWMGGLFIQFGSWFASHLDSTFD